MKMAIMLRKRKWFEQGLIMGEGGGDGDRMASHSSSLVLLSIV